MNELIKIKQFPEIEEHFVAASKELKVRLEKVNNLVVTPDNKIEVKKIRAELNKEKTQFKNDWKKFSDAILEPYNKVKETYKDLIEKPYAEADEMLKVKITDIEQVELDIKQEELETYFNELSTKLNTSMAEFKEVVPKVTLSTSVKAYKEEIKAYLEAIATDLETIDSMENSDEVLIEYKNTRNLAIAMKNVKDRNEELELQRKLKEQREAQRVENQAIESAVEVAVAATPVEVEEVQAPEPTVEPMEVEEKILTMAFKVYGSKEQFQDLVNCMKALGIKYESIK